MKLALLAARLPPATDGVGDHADRLARALSDAGHEVVAMTAGEAAPPAHYRLEITGGSWGPLATARAVAILRAQRVDALVVEYTPFLFGARSQTPLALLLAARALGIRSVAIAHEAFHARGSTATPAAWRSAIFAARDAATLSCADAIAVPSEARARAIAERLPAARGRISVVPIGANVEPPPAYERRPRGPATVVAFGVVMPRRRLERCVSALAHVVAGGGDLRLDIIGRKHDVHYAARIAALAASAGVGDRVRFRGALEPAALSHELGAAAAAIHTAQEGSIASSGSLLALLAHGLPTVALRTLADDPVFSGAVTYADDDAALAASLHTLTTETRCASGLGRAAADCYRENFAWTTVAQRLQLALCLEHPDARLVTA
jgi:glycosyltransferase involved in cell wall biosynthesis